RPELRLEHKYTIIEAMKDILKSRAFLTRTAYIFFGNIARAMGFSFVFVYILILGNGPLIPFYFMVVTMGIGFFSQALYMRMEPKWGMRKTILTFKSLLIGSNIICFFIVLNTNIPAIIWLCLGITSIFSGFNVFDFALLTIAIDEDELQHGSRRESIFQGTSSLIFKPADSIGPIIATSILLLFGFTTGSTIQSATAIIGIKFLLFVMPSILHAISLIFIYLFPYYGEKYEQLRRELRELHVKKKLEYEQKSL
ncbi:MAG: MFS transporter, partial [Promethearchaeota archaeon]